MVYNIDADHEVPDSVVIDVQRILSVTHDNKWKPEDRSGFTQNDLEKKLGISNWNPFATPVLEIPFDYSDTSRRSTTDMIAQLMLLMLRFVPIVSMKDKRNSDEIFRKKDFTGLYIPAGNSSSSSYGGRPHIEIFSDKIWDCYKGDQQKFEKKVLRTLIHELAHAVMDTENYKGGLAKKVSEYTKILCSVKDITDQIPKRYSLDFYTYREESLADLLMYKVIMSTARTAKRDDWTRDLLDYMNRKPLQYRLAAYLIKQDPDVFGWMRSKDGRFSDMVVATDYAIEWMEKALECESDPRSMVDIKAYAENEMLPFFDFEKERNFPWI